MYLFLRQMGLLLGLLVTLVATAQAAQTETHPFRGVRLIHRTETAPRLLDIRVVDIDLTDPAIKFRVTPPNGPSVENETTIQTTLAFLRATGAQLAINAHFYSIGQPHVEDIGLSASDGDIYSPFNPENWPALAITRDNKAAIVNPDPADISRKTSIPKMDIYNAVAGNERIIQGGRLVAADQTIHPRTAVGLTTDSTHMIIFVVDGRNPGHSDGMTTIEEAQMMMEYGAADAINLDGGGSSTLCIADPKPHVVNIPVGIDDVPGSERPVGTNLAIFAAPADAPR